MKTFFLFFLIFSSAFGSDHLPFKTFSSFKANFSQIRFIKASNIKLKSEGNILKKETSVIWKQIKPFENIIDLSKETKNPIAKRMGDTILSVVKGNLKKLKKDFFIQKKRNRIVLTPKEELYKKFLKSIEVSGKKYIDKFILKELSGNYIEIKFSDYEDLSDGKK